jgi:prophage antirepressor-like protein
MKYPYRRYMSTKRAGEAEDTELKTILIEAGDPVLTAVDVAEELGITQQAAHARLSSAHRREEVDRKKVGARAVVWWVPGYEPESDASL